MHGGVEGANWRCCGCLLSQKSHHGLTIVSFTAIPMSRGSLMRDMLDHIPNVIREAAQSNLGVLALLIVVLSILAFMFFRSAGPRIRLFVYFSFFIGTCCFGFAILTNPLPNESGSLQDAIASPDQPMVQPTFIDTLEVANNSRQELHALDPGPVLLAGIVVDAHSELAIAQAAISASCEDWLASPKYSDSHGRFIINVPYSYIGHLIYISIWKEKYHRESTSFTLQSSMSDLTIYLEGVDGVSGP